MTRETARPTPRHFTIALAPLAGEREPTSFEVRLPDVPGQTLGTARSFRLPIETDLLGRRLRTLEAEIDSPHDHEQGNLREMGRQLFDALFVGVVRERLAVELEALDSDPRAVLHIRLLIDPERPGGRTLSALPWELLYDLRRREPLGLSTRTPIVRQLPVPRARKLPKLDGPLRIAVVVASPRGYPPLALADERERIERISHRSKVDVEVLDSGTHDELRQKLRAGRFHGVHFMGHGEIDPRTGAGALVFETGEGEGDPVSGDSLALTLRDCPEIRFAVLNACGSGHLPRAEGLDPYTGVGTALIMAGLPAVVAMQFPISDRAALAFSASFYGFLAEGASVESAVVEGRKAIHRAFDGSFEWAIPALYVGEGGGEIVAQAQVEIPEASSPQAPTPASKFHNEIENSEGIVIGDGHTFGTWNFGGGK